MRHRKVRQTTRIEKSLLIVGSGTRDLVDAETARLTMSQFQSHNNIQQKNNQRDQMRGR